MRYKALQSKRRFFIVINLMGILGLCGMVPASHSKAKSLQRLIQLNASTDPLNLEWLKLGLKRFIEINLANTTFAQMPPGLEMYITRCPGITAIDYLKRLENHLYCSYACFVLALIYIHRLIDKNENNFNIFNQNTFYKMYFVATLLAIKYNDDVFHSNVYYSVISGISLTSINTLESNFLASIKFELFVSQAEWSSVIGQIKKLGDMDELEINKLIDSVTKLAKKT